MNIDCPMKWYWLVVRFISVLWLLERMTPILLLNFGNLIKCSSRISNLGRCDSFKGRDGNWFFLHALWFLHVWSFTFSVLSLLVKLGFPLEELRIHLFDVFIELRLESHHGNVEIGFDNWNFVTFIETEVEGLDVIMVRQDAIDLCLNKNERNESRQMVGCYLLVLVQRLGLDYDFHDFL